MLLLAEDSLLLVLVLSGLTVSAIWVSWVGLGCLGFCCMGTLLAVFSPVAVVGLVEITGVTGCLGLELGFALSGGACVGLDCLGVCCFVRGCRVGFRRDNWHQMLVGVRSTRWCSILIWTWTAILWRNLFWGCVS